MMIINRIAQVAKRQGLSISALAQAAEVTYNTAYDLYHDRAKRIGIETLDRICRALGVQPGELFAWQEENDVATRQ